MRVFGNLLLVAVVAVVLGFFAAPGVAFFALRSAADSADATALARLVDYSAVRSALRPQLSGDPALDAPAPSFLEDPLGAVRRRFEARAAGGPDIDAFLTPAALAALTRGEGRLAALRTGATTPAAGDPVPTPVYWGVNRARLAVTDDGGSETIFTFERRGPFEWRLVHIGLPEGVTPETVRAAPTPDAG